MARIAVITDIHYIPDGGMSPRSRADVLLLHAAEQLNRTIRPDATVVLGDLVNDGMSVEATNAFSRLKTILGTINAPVIVLPGNHDTRGPSLDTSPSDQFDNVFGDLEPVVTVDDCRLLTFRDRDVPGFHSVRSPADLDRMRQARNGFNGSLVSVQHVPIFPPGTSDCPYHCVNAENVLAAMRASGFCAAISGHYHTGMTVRTTDAVYFAASAFSEPPFPIHVIDVKNGCVQIEHQALPRFAEISEAFLDVR